MKSKTSIRFILLASAALSLAGCSNVLDKLSEVGQQPKTTPIKDPTAQPGYTPVSMPMPSPVQPQAGTNSLWRPGARAFFKDQRASDVGDLITVTVNINDSGSLSNKTQTSTANSEAANANTTLFGLQNSLKKIGAPNGNLVINGRQELTVNGDLRILAVQGIIRAEDISTLNTINSQQIAEARITYGGRGTITDIQQARYGQQIFDIISPF
jgi:flagellar L-ring protein precursor FlgH